MCSDGWLFVIYLLPRTEQANTAGEKEKTPARGRRFSLFGAPGEIRTPDHQVRSLVLYPTELRAHLKRSPCGEQRSEPIIIPVERFSVNCGIGKFSQNETPNADTRRHRNPLPCPHE